jgi:putative glutamine amidotransferase
MLLPGGGDVDPDLYGGDPNATMLVHRLRDDFEIALINAAREKGLPILGICRGCQIINVALGGTVRNLRLEPEIKKQHFVLNGHPVDIRPGSELTNILGVTRLEKVISLHGNAVGEPAPGVRVAATGPGGVIEAIEADSAGKRSWIIGIQWHPEMTLDKRVQHRVFDTLVDRAGRVRARRMAPEHRKIEANGLPLFGEKLFSTRALIARDKTRYDIEFYYHKWYRRIRAVVRVGDKTLSGLFNRFYGIDPKREFSLTIRWEDNSAVVYVNSVRMRLKESDIDTSAIYNATEAMLGEPTKFCIYPPPGGALRRTCRARVFTGSGSEDYLVNEQGDIEPFSLDSLCVAYRRERIRAQNPQHMEGIGVSMILAESSDRTLFAEVISGISDIPGYDDNPLDSDTERKIGEPRFYRNEKERIDYWTCHTYSMSRAIVAGYTFGFFNGWPVSAEKIVLGRGIGGISSYNYPNSYDRRVRKYRLSPTSDQGLLRLIPALRVVFIGSGLSLLFIAHLLRKRRHRIKHASSNPPVKG